MSVVKIIEVLTTSEEGIEDALRNAVEETSKTIQHIDSINVKNIKVHVKDGKISSYGINCKVAFRVEGKQ
ncbi:dodecin family protein [Belliella marina]|uniref:Dodecin family protein n=1 Tax=Belliella marina TaxID=1644146 RepID=A0ABW4VNI3_9BACT